MSISKKEVIISIDKDDPNLDKIKKLSEFLLNNKDIFLEKGVVLFVDKLHETKGGIFKITLSYYLADKPDKSDKKDYGVSGLLYNPDNALFYLSELPIESFVPLIDVRTLLTNSLKTFFVGYDEFSFDTDSVNIENLNNIDDFLQNLKFYDKDNSESESRLISSMSTMGCESLGFVATSSDMDITIFTTNLLNFQASFEEQGTDGEEVKRTLINELSSYPETTLKPFVNDIFYTVFTQAKFLSELFSYIKDYVPSDSGLVPVAFQGNAIHNKVFKKLGAEDLLDPQTQNFEKVEHFTMGLGVGSDSSILLGTNCFFDQDSIEALIKLKEKSDGLYYILDKYSGDGPDDYQHDRLFDIGDSSLDPGEGSAYTKEDFVGFIKDPKDLEKYNKLLEGVNNINEDNKDKSKIVSLTDFTNFQSNFVLKGSMPIPEPLKDDYSYLINFLETKKDVEEIKVLGYDSLKKSAENLIKSKAYSNEKYEKFIETVEESEIVPTIMLLSKHVADILRHTYMLMHRAFK